MEKPLNIVCVAQPSWDGEYAKSTVLLMKELSRNNRVLYVDYAYTWKDLANAILGKGQAPVKRMLGLHNRLREISETPFSHLYVLTLPPILPVNFLSRGWLHSFFGKINGLLISSSINKAAQKLNMKHPVVINAFAPALGKLLKGRLNESLTIYYNYDDINSAHWNCKHGSWVEPEFSKAADLVVVTSDQLKKERHHLNSKTITIKNGVDIELFERSLSTEKKSKNSNPVVGFVGSLDSRIDYKLLQETIKLLPHYNFRFVGRVTDDRFYELMDLKNVEWQKPVPYEKVPGVIRDFDIGLIPFVKSEFTSKIYPLKINEYLALGKPVVMTSFAELPEFSEVVLTADFPETFADAIQYAFYITTPEEAYRRINMARKNSWSERASQFQKVINHELQQKFA